jgi:hypothetical protein
MTDRVWVVLQPKEGQLARSGWEAVAAAHPDLEAQVCRIEPDDRA